MVADKEVVQTVALRLGAVAQRPVVHKPQCLGVAGDGLFDIVRARRARPGEVGVAKAGQCLDRDRLGAGVSRPVEQPGRLVQRRQRRRRAQAVQSLASLAYERGGSCGPVTQHGMTR